jgi:hypothetical protein
LSAKSFIGENRMGALPGYGLEPLRKDEEFILYRGHSKHAEAPPVLLLAPLSLRPALETLKKIEHEKHEGSKL